MLPRSSDVFVLQVEGGRTGVMGAGHDAVQLSGVMGAGHDSNDAVQLSEEGCFVSACPDGRIGLASCALQDAQPFILEHLPVSASPPPPSRRSCACDECCIGTCPNDALHRPWTLQTWVDARDEV